MQPLPVLAIAAMAVFISAILATVFGAVGGFIVGLVFPDTMSLLSDTIGSRPHLGSWAPCLVSLEASSGAPSPAHSNPG